MSHLMKTEFQTIPLSEIHESPHNPRKHFDAAQLNELAESIKAVGILTPLLVRPSAGANGRGTTYEIAAGHRRYRASKLAGLDQAPCLVRPLTDQQFMEILTIENLQREDVHPLDEAKGYEALMAAPYKMPVERIAERVGRSVKYVYDRVKLLGLSKEAQQLFWDGKIEAGHAILLARLTHDEQKRVIGDREVNYHNGGLLVHEHALFAGDALDGDDEHGPVKAVSVRELDKHIKQHIRFHVAAPDSFLFPETAEKVAEATQSKIKVIEITREYLAGDDVRKDGGGKVYGERSWRRADGKESSKKCDRSVLGVVTCGPGQGEAFFVCINKDKCETHWGAEIKAREKRRKEIAKGGEAAKTAKASYADQYRKQQERWEQERKEKADKHARWEAAQPKIVAAVKERVKALPAKPAGVLAEIIIKALRNASFDMAKMPPAKSLEDFLRNVAGAILMSLVTEWDAFEDFPPVAKQLGLDLAKLLPAEKPEKPAASAKAAKGKAAKTKRKAA